MVLYQFLEEGVVRVGHQAVEPDTAAGEHLFPAPAFEFNGICIFSESKRHILLCTGEVRLLCFVGCLSVTYQLVEFICIPCSTSCKESMQKKQKGIYSPEGWAHYKVTGEAAPEE